MPRQTPATDNKPADPLYLQIARALKEDILRGLFPVGSRLPSEDDLRIRFSASRFTIREALRRLREDNLVTSRQGAGTIVVPRHTTDSYVHDVMSINDLLAFAENARFVISTMKMTVLDEKTAAQTGLPAGGEWLAVRGFRHVEGEAAPSCRTEYYINRDFASVGRLLERHVGPIFPLIEDLFGQSIAEVHQEITAVQTPTSLASVLKVEPGSAALEVQRTYRMSNGIVAQVTVNTHPAERFRHAMVMRRVRS